MLTSTPRNREEVIPAENRARFVMETYTRTGAGEFHFSLYVKVRTKEGTVVLRSSVGRWQAWLLASMRVNQRT